MWNSFHFVISMKSGVKDQIKNGNRFTSAKMEKKNKEITVLSTRTGPVRKIEIGISISTLIRCGLLTK